MIYVMLAEGFEEIEALTVIDVLRRAGLEVKAVSVSGSPSVTGAYGISVNADCRLDEADAEDCELVVLPGGLLGAAKLRNSKALREALLKRASEGRMTAAICAAPYVLGELGILEGKRATCYPGFEKSLKGAVVTGAMVERDGNIITGKGPAAAAAFAFEIVEALKGKEVRDEVAGGMLAL